MKVIETKFSEPVVKLEMSLSELKQLRDILGAFSPVEVEARVRRAVDVHPNFKEFITRTFNFLCDQITEICRVSTPSESSGIKSRLK